MRIEGRAIFIVYSAEELRSNGLSLEKAQINLAFCLLIRNFAAINELLCHLDFPISCLQ